MTVCPVCEHAQAQGNECEVCGKVFAGVRVADVPVAALPELERTAFGKSVDVPVPALAELERTQLTAGPDLPAVRLLDVELTAAAPVGEVPVERIGELDLARHVDTGPRTALPLVRVCRYCQNRQAEGLTCDRCGMMLPGGGPVPEVTVASNREAPTIKCLQCGSRVVVGEVCGGCGIQA